MMTEILDWMGSNGIWGDFVRRDIWTTTNRVFKRMEEIDINKAYLSKDKMVRKMYNFFYEVKRIGSETLLVWIRIQSGMVDDGTTA